MKTFIKSGFWATKKTGAPPKGWLDLTKLIKEGKQYIFVTANGTPTENAAELQDAYNTAKTMSPTVDNRITVIASPGNYKFSSTLILDTEFIDLVSLTGNSDIIILSDSLTLVVDIKANNILVKGLKTSKTINVTGDNLNFLVVEKCIAGANSFGYSTPIVLSGTFIDCEALNGFGVIVKEANGTFIRCKLTGAGNNGFGRWNDASGVFIDCQAVSGSFGYGGKLGATGTFKRCISLGGSSFLNASGNFYNCEGYGNVSFSRPSGNLYNCIASKNGGNPAFYPPITGKLMYCRYIDGAFPTVSDGGKIYYGIDINGQNNQI